ncbi:DUF4126 domain-containing protein [Actinomadura logoneensis]|uniref:DUF4126 domain-containing protein n=1 Tax=Actinomadura logoneensis TaxID=2293572 RepID=A0A372JM98_9ACTN|nr:DUF4126 domain-containing protein [Actinomadura logoneensis]RFU40468.1 DUF4126 domain-containing protein [Actinomadura logoneensis]
MLAILTGLGLSTAAGLNAYIPVLLVGLIARYTDVLHLPDTFSWLTNGWVLTGLALLLGTELILDKVPVVDTVNDAVQTFVRPAAGGAAFAATDAAARADSSTFMHDHPWIGWVLGIAVALLVHTTKATVRPVVNAGTLGTGAPVVSVVEDVASLGMSLLAILAPVLALVALVAFAYVTLRLWRRARRRRRRARERATSAT